MGGVETGRGSFYLMLGEEEERVEGGGANAGGWRRERTMDLASFWELRTKLLDFFLGEVWYVFRGLRGDWYAMNLSRKSNRL